MIGCIEAFLGGCFISLAVACLFVDDVREYFTIRPGSDPGRLRW